MQMIPTRREVMKTAACGFAQLALAGMMARNGLAKPLDVTPSFNPLANKLPHFAARAKRVIFLFMQGGVSHVDSFDYKPALYKQDGQMMSFDDARVIANTGQRGSSKKIMKPLWDFAQRGECGRWTSSLFPEMGKHVDQMCFVHSMHTEGVAHGPATLFLHCGSTQFIRPSMGSWIMYGLGTENDNLPGFVSIAPATGNGGPRNYGNAFLPPVYQGTPIGTASGPASSLLIRNLKSANGSLADQRQQFKLIRKLNGQQLAARPGDAEVEAVIDSYELAWRMQMNAPDVLDLSKESPSTLALYGIDSEPTDVYGRQCLMARRLVESGVRYVQVTYGDNSANPAWDQHSNMPKHADHAAKVDKPIAGLLTDLAQRGLLEDTLVWWGGEFGRTPYSQGGSGRDHNPSGFTQWLAGAGVKPGFAYGSTDDFGHQAVTGKVHMHDLHATILHLLGLNHEQLTYRYAGRDFRLTDVFGNVVRDIIA